MSISPPSLEILKDKFPQLAEPTEIKSGGFKTVYRAAIEGRPEAFKIIGLPGQGQVEAGVAFHVTAQVPLRHTGESRYPDLDSGFRRNDGLE